MAENQPYTEPIRVFDVQDRKFTMWVLGLSTAITVGLTLIGMAASFQLGSDTAETEGQKSFLIGLSQRYLAFGLAALASGFGGMYVTNKKMNRSRRHRHLDYDPRDSNEFVIVIEGVGSHGHPERAWHADNIMELAVRDLIIGGNEVKKARFYSSAGIRNLLLQQA